MKDLIKKLINKETITYIIFGILTTLINYAAYWLFHEVLRIPNAVANIIAWVIAVLFAFITNKIWVFESRTNSFKEFFSELWKFVLARILSFVVEEAFMILAVDIFKIDDKVPHGSLIAKVVISVAVVIINYFASKLLIFKKKGNEVTDDGIKEESEQS